MVNRYVVGETVRAIVSFADAAGAAVAASGITVTVKNPAGTVAEALVLTAADGSRYSDIAATAAGQWRLRLAADGPIPAATETSFEVTASRVV